MVGEELPTVWIRLSIYWEEVLDHLHTAYQQLQQKRVKKSCHTGFGVPFSNHLQWLLRSYVEAFPTDLRL